MVIDVLLFGYLVPYLHFCSHSSRQHIQNITWHWDMMVDTRAPQWLLLIFDRVSPVQWELGVFIFVVYFCCCSHLYSFSQQCAPGSSMATSCKVSLRIFVTKRIYFKNPQVMGQADWLGSNLLVEACRHHLSHYSLAEAVTHQSSGLQMESTPTES